MRWRNRRFFDLDFSDPRRRRRLMFFLVASVLEIILLATVYKGAELIMGHDTVAWGQLALGAFVSAIVAYLSIEFFMRFVSRIGLAPFAVYRLALAAVILYVLV